MGQGVLTPTRLPFPRVGGVLHCGPMRIVFAAVGKTAHEMRYGPKPVAAKRYSDLIRGQRHD